VLLLNTGLLLRSFFRLMATSPGFETRTALEFGIGLPEKRYDTTSKEIAYHETLTRKLAEVPAWSVWARWGVALARTVAAGGFSRFGEGIFRFCNGEGRREHSDPWLFRPRWGFR